MVRVWSPSALEKPPELENTDDMNALLSVIWLEIKHSTVVPSILHWRAGTHVPLLAFVLGYRLGAAMHTDLPPRARP